jgi:hypothetical protein
MGQEPATDLERCLAQAQRELSEALERQTATDEVLRVIANSPGELEPVFQAMLASAIRICEAKFGTLLLLRKIDFGWWLCMALRMSSKNFDGATPQFRSMFAASSRLGRSSTLPTSRKKNHTQAPPWKHQRVRCR